MKNIIILTHGWTGSSIFAALFGEAGHWLGSQTMVKPDYDTFENAGLVALNDRILQRLLPGLNHQHRFSDQDVQDLARRATAIDRQLCREFVAACDDHRPWLWKDPRLTWTIRTWADVLDLDQTAFLVLTRDPTQGWISANLRRHIQSFAFTRAYNDGVTQSNLRFLEERGLPHLRLSFEDLLLDPGGTLAALNRFFGTTMALDQLHAVCRLPLYRKSRDWKDFAVAAMIYLKNFHERDGRGRHAALMTE